MSGDFARPCGLKFLQGSDALGTKPEFGSLPRPWDATIMSEAGVTTIIVGPGDLAMNAHGANEFVPVQQVVDACKVYASLMVDCGD